MIISAQIRAARTALGWTTSQLADYAGVATRTVLRLETSRGIPNANANTLHKIQAALEAAGIEFIGSPDDAPGIRIHAPK
ncbi:helix-turn-helix domain-containing protein [Sphingorhabdus pulchriflava]|uniref:Helix-turn-helix domain-containing protein n=1 Tax=Sphingorhabdus pulchriflava TaxID=2292257 RepID=A0A371B1Y2_9SPHN|nr:helix-turn-helix domain-containing protein [Sphingorhabdus pulchriflava]RDV01461.1 helix-turn-helix domain-containing protein [Sphingorhabdus pulchriflava]